MMLYSTHCNPNAIESIQFSLNKIYEYLKYRNLEISPAKSSWIGFTQGSQDFIQIIHQWDFRSLEYNYIVFWESYWIAI